MPEERTTIRVALSARAETVLLTVLVMLTAALVMALVR
jgi:hypothetical protein